MKVAKWGNSLAVRLPAALVETLNLKEGDDVGLTARSANELEVSPDLARQRALAEIRKLQKPLPADYKFNREELYERGRREPVENVQQGTAAD